MSGMSYLIGVSAAVAITTALLLFPVRAVLRRCGVIDKPNERSSHSVTTIRGAGAAIVAIVAMILGLEARHDLALWWLAAAFVLLAIVSFADDLEGLGAPIRFSVHGVVAVAGLCLVGRGAEMSPTRLFGCGAVAWLWVTGYTNAFNFMDGINGIAGMQAVVTGLGTAAVALQLGVAPAETSVVVAVGTAAAALGFIPHNFPRARVFMGDVGSAPLGFILSLLAVWIAAKTNAWVLPWIALLHANFVLDTAITLTRRALRGEKVWQAHREHFYQRLVRAGQSHTRVTLTEGALQIVVAVMVVAGTNGSPAVRGAIGAVVVAIWCFYFGYAERVFRRAQELAREIPKSRNAEMPK